MKTHKVDNLFEKFQQTRYWDKLPNLQKGLMLKTLERAYECESTAKELCKLIESLMQQPKRMPRIRLR